MLKATKDANPHLHDCIIAALETGMRHDVKPERTRGKLSAENRAKLAEIDLNFHDLRHEAGSRKLEGGWPLHAVSAWLGHTKLETTAKYFERDGAIPARTQRSRQFEACPAGEA